MVEVARDERVVRVTLNRAEKLNALDEEIRSGLDTVVRELAEDPTVSVMVLSGAGRSFSAGADLSGSGRPSSGSGAPSGSAASPERTWAMRRHAAGAWQRTLDALEELPQVTVAALHGHCVGGAALLALACDIRVADPSLHVSIPELAIGIPLTWAGVPRLAREIGLPLARDLVMTGRQIDGAEAQRCGFVQRLAAAGQLDAAVRQLVQELLAMPAAPLALTKAMTRALGKERGAALAWADADLLQWSGREPESRDAAVSYLRSRLER